MSVSQLASPLQNSYSHKVIYNGSVFCQVIFPSAQSMQTCLRNFSSSDAQILSHSFENHDKYAYIRWLNGENVVFFSTQCSAESSIAMLMLSVRPLVRPSVHKVEAPWSYLWGYFKSNYMDN